jgi:pimeloyl-ACP methyl ester carboxylesterase
MRFQFSDVLIDTQSRELRRGATLVPVEPQVFDLLVYLVENRHRVIGQEELLDTVWNGRIVSQSTLTSRINAARAAIGDSGAEQRLIKTVSRKGYRFVGLGLGLGGPNAAPTPGQALRQEIHFCTACDGVRIAYACVGKGGPVVKAGNWLNHLEYDWESPIWSPLLHWFVEHHRFVRYDARGNGLSDWEVEDISFDAFVRDLESVADAAELERFSLFGVSQGCAISIAYAVRHPERVDRLVLYGGFALGRRLRGSPMDIDQAEAMVTLMRTGWGQANPAFRQLFTSLFVPGGTTEQVNWFNDLQRKSTSPENAVRIRLVSDYMNVVELLPRVKAPTLVLHCRDDAVQPFDEGRRIAAAIPNARFVPLEGRNHLILETDPGWPKFRDEVGTFLAS